VNGTGVPLVTPSEEETAREVRRFVDEVLAA